MIKRRFEDIRKGGQTEGRPLPSDMCPCCWIDPTQGVPAGAHNKACAWLSYLLSHPWNRDQLGFKEKGSPRPPDCLPSLNAELKARAPWDQQHTTCEQHSEDVTLEALKQLRKDPAMRKCIPQDNLDLLVAAMKKFRLFFPLHRDGVRPRLPEGLPKTVGDGSGATRGKNQPLHLTLHDTYLESAGPLRTSKGEGWLALAKTDDDPDWTQQVSVKAEGSGTAAQARAGAQDVDCLCFDFNLKKRSRCGYIKKGSSDGQKAATCIL